MNKLSELQDKFNEMQNIYGAEELNCIYGGGCEKGADVCLVFMNPTKRNVATSKAWTGIRTQWLGTKEIWKYLTAIGLLDTELNAEIQTKKTAGWTPEFCEKVYREVKNKKLYITNLAKCSQVDARPLNDNVFMQYLDLLKQEIDIVNPKKVILFGNQVSSIVLGEKITVSTCRKKKFILKTSKRNYETYCVFYPVGNGRFNITESIEDCKFALVNVL